MTVQFACEHCGSPSVELPLEFTDTASILCKGCGARLGTWGDFKRHARTVILSEAIDPARPVAAVSSDPLDVSAMPSPAPSGFA